MKYLLLEKETPHTQADDFQDYLEDEAAHVWLLVQQGVIRETYFAADTHTAVMILECADREEVDRYVAGFPLVKADLITFEVIPLKPYDGFVRLFRGE